MIKAAIAAALLMISAGAQANDKEAMVKQIPKTHPRILLTDARVSELKSLLKTDPELQKLVAALERVGDCIVNREPVEYRLDGVKRFRLLATSRLVLCRSLVLGTLYRLDGNPKWRNRLTAELKTVCSFKDWYPTHFLDTAEMSAAVAFGYDWLHNDLSAEDRELIRDGLVRLGVKPGVNRKHWWITRDNNWNQVCHGSMVLAAVAVAHHVPDDAEKLLQSAKENYNHGMHPYAPDGIYPEGPGYWNYGTSFSVIMASVLSSVFGTDWGLLDKPGFQQSFVYRMHVQTPTGRVINYSDGGEYTKSSPYHLYLAQERQTPGFRAFALESIQQDYDRIHDDRYKDTLDSKVNRLLALAVAWYTPEDTDRELPLDWFGTGKGQVHVAAMRSQWNDKNAVFASIKAGKLTVSHGHLDAGTFLIESDGVRWTSDLGSEKEIYDRSNTWSLKQDSARWDFFRTNNFGHNTLSIDNQLQRVSGSAPIIATSSNDSPFAIADLSAAYQGQADSVKRGISLVHRKTVWLQDELTGIDKGKDIRWNLLTRATLSLSEDKKTATFSRKGKHLTATLLSPATATFTVTDATPPLKEENQNKGYSRLLIDMESTGDPMTIAVQLTPGPDASPALPPKPLSDWSE